jgi:hypothetical protein
MKVLTRKKLRKHERERHRYLLIYYKDRVNALGLLKGFNNKEMILVVGSLKNKQRDRVIIKVNRKDIDRIKLLFKERGIVVINVSGTLKGLLR